MLFMSEFLASSGVDFARVGNVACPAYTAYISLAAFRQGKLEDVTVSIS